MSKVEKLRKEMVDVSQRLNEISREIDGIGFEMEIEREPSRTWRALDGKIERMPASFAVVATRTITEKIQ